MSKNLQQKVYIMWTYIANFSDQAIYIRLVGGESVEWAIWKHFRYYSKDFWKKANFHIFQDDTYTKISASEIAVRVAPVLELEQSQRKTYPLRGT